MDVVNAISKELLSTSDHLLLGRYLAERFRNASASLLRDEMLQALAESLDSKCSIAFVTLQTGGGGELEPPLLLAHAGSVIETTAEHLARMVEGCHTAVIKFSHMENRVRQLGLCGLSRPTLRLSETFRASVVASLINDSKMEDVRKSPVENAHGFPAVIPRAPECAKMDASLFQLDVKRRRVAERAERDGIMPTDHSVARGF
jgi:hypothetical protein